MLDMKFVRENPELVEKAMKNRNMDMNLDEFLTLENNVGKSYSRLRL